MRISTYTYSFVVPPIFTKVKHFKKLFYSKGIIRLTKTSCICVNDWWVDKKIKKLHISFLLSAPIKKLANKHQHESINLSHPIKLTINKL